MVNEKLSPSKRLKPRDLAKKIHCANTAVAAADICIAQKALDVRILDIKSVADFADLFLIASGTSDRHVKGIVDKIIDVIESSYQQKPLSICGYERGEWILVDYGDLVIHVFHEQIRQFYDLDGLWSNAPAIPLPHDLEANAKMFRTGMYR